MITMLSKYFILIIFIVISMSYSILTSLKYETIFIDSVKRDATIAYQSVNGSRGWGFKYEFDIIYVFAFEEYNVTEIQLEISGSFLISDLELLFSSDQAESFPLNDTIILSFHIFINNSEKPYYTTNKVVLGKYPHIYGPLGWSQGFVFIANICDPLKPIYLRMVIELYSYNGTYVSGNYTMLNITLPPPILYLPSPPVDEPHYVLLILIVLLISTLLMNNLRVRG